MLFPLKLSGSYLKVCDSYLKLCDSIIFASDISLKASDTSPKACGNYPAVCGNYHILCGSYQNALGSYRGNYDSYRPSSGSSPKDCGSYRSQKLFYLKHSAKCGIAVANANIVFVGIPIDSREINFGFHIGIHSYLFYYCSVAVGNGDSSISNSGVEEYRKCSVVYKGGYGNRDIRLNFVCTKYPRSGHCGLS